MSALRDVFPRVHFRYDEDPYAVDLEQFAAWLRERRYPNKGARTHLYNVQQVLRALSRVSGAALDSTKLAMTFRRSAVGKITYQHTHTRFTEYLRSRNLLIEPAKPEERFEDIRPEFCERLARRRGLRPSTIDGYNCWISDFLGRYLGPRQPLGSLTTAMFNLIESQDYGDRERAGAFVFKNRMGAPLTRFGVRYLLRKYLPDYLSPARRRGIHPHSLRQSHSSTGNTRL